MFINFINKFVCLVLQILFLYPTKSKSKDTRITRCHTPYDAVGPRLSRIFVRERESEERYSEQLFSTHTLIDNSMCAHVYAHAL